MQQTIESLAVELGVPMSTIHWWRRYGRVAYRHRLPLVEAARAKGMSLTDADFDSFGLIRPRHPVTPASDVVAETAERACFANVANCDGLSSGEAA